MRRLAIAALVKAFDASEYLGRRALLAAEVWHDFDFSATGYKVILCARAIQRVREKLRAIGRAAD